MALPMDGRFGEVEAALALVESLEPDGYHYLHATRADPRRLLDRVDEAREGRLAELPG